MQKKHKTKKIAPQHARQQRKSNWNWELLDGIVLYIADRIISSHML
jgi:hypothetical protein